MKHDRVLMSHGSGGSMMKSLIDEVFLDCFGEDPTTQGDDAFVGDLSTVLPEALSNSRIAMSTDTFVVTPRFFPGGDIGRLAVCGTVNDVATSGAKVLFLSCGFVLEEGLPIDDLRAVCQSMAAAASEAGVHIVTGDTKVVERGSCDGLYINTSGVGFVPQGVSLSGRNCKPGDLILLSGTLGDHGIAVMVAREGLGLQTTIESDAAPLNALISSVIEAAPSVRCFRDPTRGGLASTLNELAFQSNVSMNVREVDVPVKDQVRGCCDMLGYDVFQVANEGKMLCIVPAEEAIPALEAMQSNQYGKDAAIIGEVLDVSAGKSPIVTVETSLGSRRIMDMLVGEQLPRIC